MVYREYTPFFMENSVFRGINRLNHLLVFYPSEGPAAYLRLVHTTGAPSGVSIKLMIAFRADKAVVEDLLSGLLKKEFVV